MNNLELARLHLAKELLKQDEPSTKRQTEAWAQIMALTTEYPDNGYLSTAARCLEGEYIYVETAIEALVAATLTEALEGEHEYKIMGRIDSVDCESYTTFTQYITARNEDEALYKLSTIPEYLHGSYAIDLVQEK